MAYVLALVLTLFALGLVWWKYPHKDDERAFFRKMEEQSRAERRQQMPQARNSNGALLFWV